jgi:hypothetical protein
VGWLSWQAPWDMPSKSNEEEGDALNGRGLQGAKGTTPSLPLPGVLVVNLLQNSSMFSWGARCLPLRRGMVTVTSGTTILLCRRRCMGMPELVSDMVDAAVELQRCRPLL